MGALATANKHLQRKTDAADADIGGLKVRNCALVIIDKNGMRASLVVLLLMGIDGM